MEHAFIRNIFDCDELKLSKPIKTHKKYHENFRKMLQIVVLLNNNYSKESDIKGIFDDCIIEFVNAINFDIFTDLYFEIENTEIKNLKWEDRRDAKLNKLITFVYYSLMDFLKNKFEIKTVVTKDFLKSVRNLIYGSYEIHPSHVTGETVG